jgi:hypothetical protein
VDTDQLKNATLLIRVFRNGPVKQEALMVATTYNESANKSAKLRQKDRDARWTKSFFSSSSGSNDQI